MIGLRPRAARAALTPRYSAAGVLVGLAATMAAFITASAPAVAQSPLDRWTCMQIEDLDRFTATEGGYSFNNFRLRLTTDFTDRQVIEASFSAVNRTNESMFVSSTFLALGPPTAHAPVTAISAKPDFGLVRAQDTAQVKASVFVEAGEFDDIHAICLRLLF